MESVIRSVPNYQMNCIQDLREPKISPVIKSVISSIVEAIFDTLGLINPIVFVYKIFL
jgi:hypothetical protein